MNDSAKKLEKDEIPNSRDTIPDGIDHELFQDGLEESSVKIKTTPPPESSLFKNIIGKAHLWALETVIVELPSEPEPENPHIVEFKTGIQSIIRTTYLSAAWEHLTNPLTEESIANIEHTRLHAIRYGDRLANYNYSNYIDLVSVNKIVETLTTGDWLSDEGLKAIENKLLSILRLPSKKV